MTDTFSFVTSPVYGIGRLLFFLPQNLFKTVYRVGKTVSAGLSLRLPVYMATKLYAEFFHCHGVSYSSLKVKRQETVALRQRMCDSQRTNAAGDACRRILQCCTNERHIR